MSTTNPVAGNQYFTRVTKSTSKDADTNSTNVVGTNVSVGQKFKESFDIISTTITTQAISLTTVTTIANNTGTAFASLAAGIPGQVKRISLLAGGTGTLAITLTGNTTTTDVVTLTYAATGVFCELLYTTTNGWVFIAGNGAAVA